MKLRIADPFHPRGAPGRTTLPLRAAIACAAAIGVASCATPDRRTPDERAEDGAIVSRVQVALEADPDIYSSHIDVNSRRGVVWLTGWVSSAQESAAAVRDTKTVPGVKQVVNEMDLMDWEPHY